MSIYIHNWYSDMLLSVRVLFDNHIFQNRDYIKRYEFNMGNRTIQLPHDYKPNYEFPNMIVTINDDSPTYGQRPSVSQNFLGVNIDQIPVLYNNTTEITLYVQEEMSNVPISCTINCESQFQAKEISNLIKRWLPVNKYIQFLTFVSYLEVSTEFLSRVTFDPATQSIDNLYTKLNKKTGEVDYCFALQYDPFIRLDSVSSAIPDSTQRSFQVVVDLTYMIQRPLSMFSDKQPAALERINFTISPNAGFEPINDYPSSKIINYLSDNVADLKKGFVRRRYMLTDNEPVETKTDLDSVSLTSLQVTNISTGGSYIIATKGANDYLYITVGPSETKYRVKLDAIPIFDIPCDICTGLVIQPLPTGVTITLSEDRYLNILQDLAGKITVELIGVRQGLTVKFDPRDFPMSDQYSYDLIKGSNYLKSYSEYSIDFPNNSITFYFNQSDFAIYAPSLTSPLMIQFYLENVTFPFSIGGIPPKIGMVRALNISQTTAEISWVSDKQTTSQVEYAEESTDYNTLSELNSNFVFDHKVLLTGLNSQLNYHFRVNTTSVEGEEYLSEDYTFRTSV